MAADTRFEGHAYIWIDSTRDRPLTGLLRADPADPNCFRLDVALEPGVEPVTLYPRSPKCISPCAAEEAQAHARLNLHHLLCTLQRRTPRLMEAEALAASTRAQETWEQSVASGGRVAGGTFAGRVIQ